MSSWEGMYSATKDAGSFFRDLLGGNRKSESRISWMNSAGHLGTQLTYCTLLNGSRTIDSEFLIDLVSLSIQWTLESWQQFAHNPEKMAIRPVDPSSSRKP